MRPARVGLPGLRSAFWESTTVDLMRRTRRSANKGNERYKSRDKDHSLDTSASSEKSVCLTPFRLAGPRCTRWAAG